MIARHFVGRFYGWFSLAMALVCVLVGTSRTQAVEQAREFLDKLREERYYDEAIAYLDSMKDSPLVSVEFKKTLLYERGLTLVEGSKYKRDNVLREKDLNQALESLKQFLAEKPDELFIMAAQNQMGNVTVERGRMLVERAKRQPEKRDELLAQAKPQFEEAIKVFRGLRDELKAKLTALPPIPETLDPKEKQPGILRDFQKRERWRSDYLQSQLLSAAASEELAEAFKPGSKEHTDTLFAAAKEYGEIHDKYRRKGAGIFARQYQARCLLKLQGQKDKKHITDALTFLGEILGEEGGDPTIRRIKMSTYELATQAWLDAELYADSVLKGGAWIDDARPGENKEPELQQIRVNVAEAILKYAADLKKKDPNSREAKQALSKGREYLKDALKYGDTAIKRKVGDLLPQFGGGGAAAEETANADKQPKDFAEAMEFGKESLTAFNNAQQLIKLIAPKIKQESDQKVREEMERNVEEARQTLGTAKGQALRYFHTALQLAQPDASEDDLNAARYYLCYLEYDVGNFYNALTYGQFLALRYPNSAGARQGALIAMASCQKLYAEEKGTDKEFESQKILKIAQYIVEKWPEEKEAEEALNTLIPFLIRAGRLDDAEKYVQQIPETSAYRGMAELKTGQALWANYLLGMKDVRELENNLKEWEKDGFPENRTAASVNADISKLKTPLETLKKRAQQTLVEGVKRMQAAGDVNAVVASASLSLSQIFVDTNQPAAAVTMLEDAKIGALTLVNNKDEAVSREGFAEEVYKTALRAYISSLATSKNADETVNKAKAVMNGLKERLGTTPEGEQKLVQNYVGVAKDLQTQLDLATDEATRGNLAKGFEVFLRQVGDQAADFQILNWVAETFRRMGDAFGRDAKTNRPKEKALAYYEEAIKTYEKLLAKADADPTFLPNEKARPAILQQLAITYRDVGKFADAAKKFREILSASPGLISVQMEAAYNYQAWAAYGPEQAKYYNSAVMGYTDPKTKKLIIWGWKPLADKIASDVRFEQQFYEARYNLAVCRFKYGLSKESKDPIRKKLVDMSKLDVELTAKLFPQLGGEQWRQKFDVLLKNIQKEAGEVPKGLAGIQFDTSTEVKKGTN